MRIGGALFLIAVGAILKFAVHVNTTHGININMIGLILMIVGAVGLLAEAVYVSTRRRTDVVQHTPRGTTRTTYAEPQDTDPRY